MCADFLLLTRHHIIMTKCRSSDSKLDVGCSYCALCFKWYLFAGWNEIDLSEFWSGAEKLYLMQSNFICSRETLFDAEQFYLQQRNVFDAERYYAPQINFICDAEKHYSQQETLFIFLAFWATVVRPKRDAKILKNIIFKKMNLIGNNLLLTAVYPFNNNYLNKSFRYDKVSWAYIVIWRRLFLMALYEHNHQAISFTKTAFKNTQHR